MSLSVKQIKNGINFLDWVKNDFQMVKTDPLYGGFINIGIEMFDEDKKLKKGFEIVVNNYKFFIPIMTELKLAFEDEPSLEETIIIVLE